MKQDLTILPLFDLFSIKTFNHIKLFNENKGLGVVKPLTSACKFNKTIE